MKESEIKRMSIEQIIKQVGINLLPQDIIITMEEEDIEKIKRSKTFLEEGSQKEYPKRLVQVLRQNEKSLNKVALVMLILENNILAMKEQLPNSPEYERAREEIGKNIERAKQILSGTDKRIYKVIGDKEIRIETLSAQELVSGRNSRKNNEKLMELKGKGIALGEILNSIILTDLGYIICEKELGELLRYQALNNAAVDKNIDTGNGRIIEPQQEIEKLKEQLTYREILPEIEEAIKDNIEYIDFDKLVLCGAYRYIEYLDAVTDIKEEERVEVIRRLNGILSYLDGKNVKIEGRIEKQQFTGYKEECEYTNISYRVKDLKQDMQKIEGTIYWGKAKEDETRQDLLLGDISLKDVNLQRVRLSKEHLKLLATTSDENYLYLLENDLINSQDVAEINSAKGNLPSGCLEMLLKQRKLSEKDIIELYMQGKADIEDMVKLDIDFEETLGVEDIYLEHLKENNEERKARLAQLYKRTMVEGKTEEEKEKNKQRIYDAYLGEMNGRYLEIFLNLGALDFEDLDGIMSDKEWIQAMQRGEVSEEFLIKLQENMIITVESVKRDKPLLNSELRLWEEGKIPSEQIAKLGVSIEELLKLSDEGKIKGSKIGEIISEEEIEKYRRQITSCYAYGMYNTIRPAIVGYNSDLINRDQAIRIIKEMKIPSKEVEKLCIEGLLNGSKIAELRYKGILSKRQFSDLKKQGFASDEQEIEVLNNLTPQEMLEELEKNGCTRISNMREILEQINAKRKHRQKGEGVRKTFDKKILNPIKREQILKTLGGDVAWTTPKNGFNGYQVFFIPKLGVAVLEKMFRKDRKKELKLSYGDATYICEMGKYIQVSGQSKREIRDFMNVQGNSNGNVSIINHTPQWGHNLIKAIQEVNPQIIIQRKNGEIDSISRQDIKLDIDVQELNKTINLMKQGEFSISLEEYE